MSRASGLAGVVSLVAALSAAPVAIAQDAPERSTDGNLNYWFKSQTWDYFNGEKKFGYSFDIFIRRQSGWDDHRMLRYALRESIRPWFVWLVNPLNKLSLSPISYHLDHGPRTSFERRDGVIRHELRNTIELDSASFLHDRVMLSSRIRLEARHLWVEERPYRFALRTRIRPRLRVSLNDKNFYDEGVVYAFGYNEIAIQAGGAQDVPNIFNQNRAFLGFGYRFEKYMRIELGYVNQYQGTPDGTRYQMNHGPMTYFQIDYLSAQYKDLATSLRERRIQREITRTQEEIDPSIRDATGPVDDEGRPVPAPPNGAQVDTAPDRPWWRRLFRRRSEPRVEARAEGSDQAPDQAPGQAPDREADAAPAEAPGEAPDRAPSPAPAKAPDEAPGEARVRAPDEAGARARGGPARWFQRLLRRQDGDDDPGDAEAPPPASGEASDGESPDPPHDGATDATGALAPTGGG